MMKQVNQQHEDRYYSIILCSSCNYCYSRNIHLIVASNIMQFSIIMEYFSLLQEQHKYSGLRLWSNDGVEMVLSWDRRCYNAHNIVGIRLDFPRFDNRRKDHFLLMRWEKTIEILQIAYIVLTVMIIVKERSSRRGAQTVKEKD